MGVDARRIPLAELGDYVERSFRQMAQQKSLQFGIYLEPGLPRTVFTDGQRLQQILRNLLSNAFKFTDRGRVTLRVGLADKNLPFDNPQLSKADIEPTAG